MANNHGYCSTEMCSCTNVDALNACGVYASGDLDNGVMVKLVKMTQDGKKNVKGYHWEVAPAGENDLGVWIVNTPEVGATLEMQLLSDPRYFYNEKGRPMSIKKLVPGVDYIEVTAECFSDTTLPNGAPNDTVKITDGGKLVGASDPPATGGYFEFVGKHYVTIGMEAVPTVILRYAEAKA